LGDWRGETIPTPRIIPTDVERKLRWVEHQVLPTIRKLAELGYVNEVMDMLSKALSADNQT